MPELNLEAQYLCESADLKECEGSVTFDVMEFGQVVSAFAVRFDNQAVGYLNRCAHVPTELDWQPGDFWDMDKRFIICAVHGALYDPPNGLCVMGPCRGKKLIPIRLQERGGQVYWYPDDQFQPVF